MFAPFMVKEGPLPLSVNVAPLLTVRAAVGSTVVSSIVTLAATVTVCPARTSIALSAEVGVEVADTHVDVMRRQVAIGRVTLDEPQLVVMRSRDGRLHVGSWQSPASLQSDAVRRRRPDGRSGRSADAFGPRMSRSRRSGEFARSWTLCRPALARAYLRMACWSLPTATARQRRRPNRRSLPVRSG